MSTTVAHKIREQPCGHRQTAARAYLRDRSMKHPFSRHTIVNHTARGLSHTAIHHEWKDRQAYVGAHPTSKGDAWLSFAAGERAMPDRCLRIFTIEFIDNLTCNVQAFIAI